jgi:hypothetical protein
MNLEYYFFEKIVNKSDACLKIKFSLAPWIISTSSAMANWLPETDFVQTTAKGA